MAQDTGHDERRSCWSASSVPLAVEPVTGGRSSTCSGLREPRGALPPILDGDCPTSALSRSGTSLGTGASLGPSRPFRVRHLTNYELPRRDLLAHVFELRLAGLVISLPTRLRHHRSLASLMAVRNPLLPAAFAIALIALLVISKRLLGQVCPAVQVLQDPLVQLAREWHDLDPRDLLAVAQPGVEKTRHCLCVVVVSERPCRLVAGSESRVEHHHADVGHCLDVRSPPPKWVSLVRGSREASPALAKRHLGVLDLLTIARPLQASQSRALRGQNPCSHAVSPRMACRISPVQVTLAARGHAYSRLWPGRPGTGALPQAPSR